MRVATLLSFPLTHPGGISTFVAGLLGALSGDPELELRLIAPPRFRAGPGQRLSQLTLAASQLVLLLRARPALVHTHEHPVLLGVAVLYRLLTAGRARVVHTVHVHPARRNSRWKRLVLGWLMGRCAAVTVVSRATADRLGDVATPTPAHASIVYGAASPRGLDRSHPAVRAFRTAYELGSGPILCQVGPLNFPDKVAGFVRLVEAFANCVQPRFPEARLVIVGDGVRRAEVETACVRAGVADRVILTGSLADPAPAVAAADVHCHISFQDACPIGLLEAMHAGKPIVAAREGGIPELLRDGEDGLLVTATAEEIGQAVVQLLLSPERARALGERAAETSRARFTWERVAAEFASVYRQVGTARR